MTSASFSIDTMRGAPPQQFISLELEDFKKFAEPMKRAGVALMATSNSPTFGQSNSPRQDGQIISLLACLPLAFCLGYFSLVFLDFL